MNAVDVGAWNANWAWSLPLIVLDVVIHVAGLGLINESIVHVLSGALSRGRFVLMFALSVAALSATVLHGTEAATWATAYRLLGGTAAFFLGLLAFAVGGTSGLLGAVFRLIFERSDRFRGAVIDWAHGKEIAGFALVIGLSTIAAGLAAWLVRKFAPGAKGSGIPDVEAVLRDEQPPPTLILIPVKFLGGVLAMGAGLALGREGPTVQLGAGIGHFIATVFRRFSVWPHAHS